MPRNEYREIKRTLKVLGILTDHPRSTSRELFNLGKPWVKVNGDGEITYKGFRQFIHKLLLTSIITTVEERVNRTKQGNLFYAYQYIPNWYVRPFEMSNIVRLPTLFTDEEWENVKRDWRNFAPSLVMD